ncbi:GMPR2 reductase, partial [Acromyrmex heyeri]
MPNIINDIKLDFKDVLLRPKRSTLKSRSDVDLFREITFRNSKQTYRGIPVMASNMDTIGTFEMAKALSKVK